jgi:murein DD-endopeptidase MepM/ murein hydrolase activator NlpD
MRLSAVAFFMILTTVFLSGCGKDNLATLEDRGSNFYGHTGVMNLASTTATQQAAPTLGVSSHDLTVAAATPAPTPPAAVAPLASAWQWPVQGKVTETFGHKSDGVANEGIVIAAAEGTPIRAAQAGEVAYVGRDTKTYGNIVIVRHAGGDMTSYAHARNIIVTKGEHVNAGGVIAYVGKSGSAKEPQLHFAVREGKSAIDPMSKLPHQLAMN